MAKLVPQILGRSESSWESHFVSDDGRRVALLGNDGYIVLLDPKNMQTTGEIKINGSVRSVSFTPDGGHIIASGSDGDISRYVAVVILVSPVTKHTQM